MLPECIPIYEYSLKKPTKRVGQYYSFFYHTLNSLAFCILKKYFIYTYLILFLKNFLNQKNYFIVNILHIVIIIDIHQL